MRAGLGAGRATNISMAIIQGSNVVGAGKEVVGIMGGREWRG